MPRRSQRGRPQRVRRLKLPRGQRRGTYQLPITTKTDKPQTPAPSRRD